MIRQLLRLTLIATLATATLIGLPPGTATADDHPQEVLDLIAAHDALAMKIRPLHDRVLVARPVPDNSTGFKPEGAPLRAKVNTTTGDDYARLRARLTALEKKAKAERERVNRPNFGVGLRATRNDEGSGRLGFGDGRTGARLPSGGKPQDGGSGGTAGSGQSVNAKEIRKARKTLAALQRELAVIERDLSALERR